MLKTSLGSVAAACLLLTPIAGSRAGEPERRGTGGSILANPSSEYASYSMTRREHYDTDDQGTRLRSPHSLIAPNPEAIGRIAIVADPDDPTRRALSIGAADNGLQRVEMAEIDGASVLIIECEARPSWGPDGDGSSPADGYPSIPISLAAAPTRAPSGQLGRLSLEFFAASDGSPRTRLRSVGGAATVPAIADRNAPFAFEPDRWNRYRVTFFSGAFASPHLAGSVIIERWIQNDGAWATVARFPEDDDANSPGGEVADVELLRPIVWGRRGAQTTPGGTLRVRRLAFLGTTPDNISSGRFDADGDEIAFRWDAASGTSPEPTLFRHEPVMLGVPTRSPADETRTTVPLRWIYDAGLLGFPESPASDAERPLVRFQYSTVGDFSSGVAATQAFVVRETGLSPFEVRARLDGLAPDTVYFIRPQYKRSPADAAWRTVPETTRHHTPATLATETPSRDVVHVFGGCTNTINADDGAAAIINRVLPDATTFTHLDDFWYYDSNRGPTDAAVLNPDDRADDAVRGYRSYLSQTEYRTIARYAGSFFNPGDHGWNPASSTASSGNAGINDRRDEPQLHADHVLAVDRALTRPWAPPTRLTLAEAQALGFDGRDAAGTPYAPGAVYSDADFRSWYAHIGKHTLLTYIEDIRFRTLPVGPVGPQIFDEAQLEFWRQACAEPHRVMILASQSPKEPFKLDDKAGSSWLPPQGGAADPLPPPEMRAQFEQMIDIWRENARPDAVLIAIAGDAHCAYVSDLVYDGGDPRVWKSITTADLDTGTKVEGRWTAADGAAFPDVPQIVPGEPFLVSATEFEAGRSREGPPLAEAKFQALRREVRLLDGATPSGVRAFDFFMSEDRHFGAVRVDESSPDLRVTLQLFSVPNGTQEASLVYEATRVVPRMCPVDVDGDGVVNEEDLRALAKSPEDINADGVIDRADYDCLEAYVRRFETERLAAPVR